MKLYVIYGDPIPLARARFGNRRVFDCQKTEKLVSALDLKRQHADTPIFEGPLHLDVTFFMYMPKSMNGKNKAKFINKPHFKKPDLDNLIKFINDICTNAELWKDDSTVVSISAKKIYSETARTEFTIKEIK